MARFIWDCDVCNKPIRDGQGYIELDDAKARERGRVVEANRHELHKRYQGGPVPASEIVYVPDIPCAVYHRACDPDPDGDHYWIGVERCRTLEDLLEWNAHLHEKNWLMHTDWDRFIQRRLAPSSLQRKAS